MLTSIGRFALLQERQASRVISTRCEEVHLHHPAEPLGLWRRSNRPMRPDAGVVHQDVQSAVGRLGCGDNGRPHGRVDDIAGDALGPAAGGGDLGCQLPQAVFPPGA